MRLLLLGGTLFIGRTIVEAALARGFEVTIFSRGRTNERLFPECERLIGDRDGDLGALRDRTWDACVDTSCYVPRVARASADLLAHNVGFYAFISSGAVYAEPGTCIDETSARAQTSEPTEDVAKHYGALKAACESVLEASFGDRVALVRPQIVVGPNDPTGRFTYWPRRFADGGTILVPDAPLQPCPLIDVRDLADFVMTLIERAAGGPWNVCGPREPATFGDVIEACRRASSSAAEIVWAPESFLLEHEVVPWIELPLWVGHDKPQRRLSNAKAAAAGLRRRTLEETVGDTLAWVLANPEDEFVADPGRSRPRPGITRERELDLLDALAAWAPPDASASSPGR